MPQSVMSSKSKKQHQLKSNGKRYYLLYREGEYYIHKGSQLSILAAAYFPMCEVIASIKSFNDVFAIKHLQAIAYGHHLENMKNRCSDLHVNS